jgi:hypothetical protein
LATRSIPKPEHANGRRRKRGPVLPLAFLAPDIVEAILKGTQPADLTATKLVRRIDLALDWPVQKRQLGFG